MTDAVRDVFLPVAAQEHLDDFVSMSEHAERAGYERVWLPETWGRDAVTVLATIAARTERVGIGTSIMNVYSRSPALMGQTAATLQEASDGRFRLGVGPSGPILMEGWHGVEYGNPLRRTREAIEVVRLVLSGETVEYDGEYFQLAGFRLRHDPPETPPPVDAGGMGPTAVELAGRFGDGWHALLATPDGIAERMADFRRGVEMADDDPEDRRVTVSLTCCALEDRERARHLTREHLAFYVGGMGTFYRDALARQGYEETANTVAQQWASGNKDEAMAAIGDDLLDDLAVAGTPAECEERVAEFAGVDGVDAVAISFPRAAERADIEATTDALAPR
ncbi:MULTISPECIES: TIGR04024 family LLM class F420-dependent oxidoreductase [Salinibaculum]|uniref:TIGR04024 family LLM class F420-dependent oxidoreductase n=1 Tax=Salinibaculum TaxID=2732368 RepID=UPI0030D209C6